MNSYLKFKLNLNNFKRQLRMMPKNSSITQLDFSSCSPRCVFFDQLEVQQVLDNLIFIPPLILQAPIIFIHCQKLSLLRMRLALFHNNCSKLFCFDDKLLKVQKRKNIWEKLSEEAKCKFRKSHHERILSIFWAFRL